MLICTYGRYLSVAWDHLAGMVNPMAPAEEPRALGTVQPRDLPGRQVSLILILSNYQHHSRAPDEPVEVAQEPLDIYGQAWHLSIDIWKMETTTVATVASWAMIAVLQ